MNIQTFITIVAVVLALFLIEFVQKEQIEELRKDVNRVSRIQLACPEYLEQGLYVSQSACVADQIRR